MIDFSIVSIWTAGAIIVVGAIQWAKGIVKQIIKRDVPTWIWSIIMPICAVGASIASGHGGKWIWNGLGIWAASQLGYEVIVKSVASFLFHAQSNQNAMQEKEGASDYAR